MNLESNVATRCNKFEVRKFISHQKMHREDVVYIEVEYIMLPMNIIGYTVLK